MGLLSWLFGASKAIQTSAPSRDEWTTSGGGNPTLLCGSKRITVFAQDKGWKYCIADTDDRREPYFSEAYANQAAAQYEALADLRNLPSRYEPLSADIAADKRQRWEEWIRERSKLIAELEQLLADDPDMNITGLRKPEAKIASHLKQLDWQRDEYRKVGVAKALQAQAEQQRAALERLAEQVAARIEAKQAQRPPRKAATADSQLSAELAGAVDELIRLFNETPLMEEQERERKSHRFNAAATERMIEEGLSFGEASGAPDFLNQDEASFKAFMKSVDQDLAWQCQTVTDGFTRYCETGDIPAPYYPMRVAVLLRKAKDPDREKQFLAAWCRHFPTGNGARYDQITTRAQKLGAIKNVHHAQ